ncbi:hypothetical protein AB0G74_16945 [Streptomyces sp. NPDC020875]|uniref:hypothetical protein n=1 Tax=Streptomyces sp. NPDC020875 TaxID=3154898 RepID=UPI0033D0D938
MIDPILRVLAGVLRFLVPARPEPVPLTVPAPPPDPWRRPWTSPTKEQAQAVLRAREQARRRRRLYIVPPGAHLPLPPGHPRR